MKLRLNALVGLVVLSICGSALAVPITAMDPIIIRQTWSANTIDGLPSSGDFLELGITVVTQADPTVGHPDTMVTATNTVTSETFGIPMSPGFTQFFHSGAAVETTADRLLGAWIYEAENNGDIADGDLVAGPLQVDVPEFATNLMAIPGGLTPTLTWTLPMDPVNRVRVFVYDDVTDEILLNTGNIGFSVTEFTIPRGILTGPGDYAFRITLVNDDHTNPGFLRARSNAFASFSVTQIPEPSTLAYMWVALGALVAIKRRPFS